MRSNLDSSEPSNHRLINNGQPFPCIPLLLILSFFFEVTLLTFFQSETIPSAAHAVLFSYKHSAFLRAALK